MHEDRFAIDIPNTNIYPREAEKPDNEGTKSTKAMETLSGQVQRLCALGVFESWCFIRSRALGIRAELLAFHRLNIRSLDLQSQRVHLAPLADGPVQFALRVVGQAQADVVSVNRL